MKHALDYICGFSALLNTIAFGEEERDENIQI